MANLTDIRSSWSTGASEGGVNVYATKEDLPTSGLTSGDQAYVTSNSRFYISNGSGWYNVALVNATPALTISPTGVIELSTEGTATTITLTATDSDNAVDGLTFSVESDGSFAGLASLSQDSSVFTITPLSQDSATTSSATLTFKASDGISFGTGDRTLSLTFAIQNSRYTTLLLKADTTKSDAQTDLSSNASTVGEVNQVFSTAHTPYHPGGYSTYFDGNDEIEVTEDSDEFEFGTSDYTIEWWFNVNTISGVQCMVTNSEPTDWQGCWYGLNNANLYILHGNGSNTWNIKTGSAVETNRWYHIAVVNNSGTISVYLDGSTTTSGISNYSQPYTWTDGNNAFHIGGRTTAANQHVTGHIRDVRIVKGTAVYTSNFTPPDEPLTAITNTSLLLCHLPYIADGSSNSLATAVSGNPETKRFGPYDHLAYSRTDHGGSVYFYGTDDYLTVDGGYLTTNTTWWNSSGFTLEVWLYKHNTNDVTIWDNRIGGNTNGFLFKTHSGGFYLYSNNADRAVNLGTNPVNIWTHVALVCSGTTGKIFQDGVQVGSDFTVPNTASYSYFGRSQNTIGAIQYTPRGAGTDYNGYMSDLRISSGSRYTGTFTPPTTAFADDGTTIFLTCKNQHDIWDANSNHVMVTNGNVTASNTQRKFNTSSAIYFDGSGDWIDLNAAAKYKFEPLGNDFTFEWWWYPTTLSQRQWFFHTATDYWLGVDFQNSSGRGLGMWASSNGSSWNLLDADNGGNGISNTNPTLNAWNHIAYTRNGNTFTLWLNGTSIVSVSSITASIVDRSSQAKVIGSWAATNHQFPIVGYIQDFRWTNGLARYTSSFTPPTAEFDG